eukprot:jgi/Orpsp1_1/1182464/evm.model.c7180000081389.1
MNNSNNQGSVEQNTYDNNNNNNIDNSNTNNESNVNAEPDDFMTYHNNDNNYYIPETENIENSYNSTNSYINGVINNTSNNQTNSENEFLNPKTIEEKLSKVYCTYNEKDTEEEKHKKCFNIGKCEPLKDNEPNNGICIFDKIFCNSNNCYIDNGCDQSYVKHPQPQYLKECERNPTLIFETCLNENDKKCETRKCESNEQCLSGSCLNEKCVVNKGNSIRYCSNNEVDEFQQSSYVFQCQLFLHEECGKDSDCLSGKCGSIEIDGHSELHCIETKITFVNAMACMLAYSVVVSTLLVLHSIYRHTKKTKSH